jgi:integrase
MSDLKDFIEKKRPNLSASSITTYASILKNLFKKVFNTDDIDIKKFDNTEQILNFLKDVPSSKRKTILSSLVIITDKKAYRDLMLEDVRNYNKEIDKQEKSETQEESWVNSNKVKEVYEELKKTAELLYKKKTLSTSDMQQIQNYIIVSLLGGIYIPPRRSKDFVDFKIKNINKEKDNYIEKNKLIFNSYKTAKTYGQQIVDIPIQLKNILQKWIKINPTDYLLFDSNMNALSSVKLNQRLNKIFEKKVGVNQLRHTFLTDKYKKTSQESKSLENDMKSMGSSKKMADTYIKLD